MSQGFLALILAAGKGTRFKSDRIKVLHPLLGKSMLQLVVDSVLSLKPQKVYVVVGYQKDEISKEVKSDKVALVHQKEQLGTAHAVMATNSVLRKVIDRDVLIINADLPLVRPQTLKPLLALHRKDKNSLTFLSTELDNPTGFGRIIRSEGKIKVIEEKDASPSVKKIKEINTGIYLFKVKDLLASLPEVSNQNKKREYYLTDVTGIMTQEGKKVGSYKTPNAVDFVGVNSRYELAQAIEVLRERKIRDLTEKGVTVLDPKTTWIDLDVKIGPDTIIYPSVVIEGRSVIGRECRLYPFTHIRNTRVGNSVEILGSTMIEDSVIENEARVGPFSRLRPNSIIRKKAKVGNFVEMKNTDLGRMSKAMHLSYLGDTEIKEEVNVGAGTITCNYDGKKKHKTYIDEGAFIGSGTELIAPVKIGKKAYIGAGSTITKDVSPEALAVSRSQQVEKKNWSRKNRKR
ncbi:MAG: bifunctional UDP-N-acetylglucosamine diphosphorylase/glucosamine-1-phosphate N-acetyltransferase GlmU [Candidatus Aminicenantes bacterium]|nr:MAG: bifunctional UDP-N-acetylglucosamine diphosphorylase/glucosamine-1-phosphate N-acetyltransferase GlmU [Candidatus Aminicenantes bacterium]